MNNVLNEIYTKIKNKEFTDIEAIKDIKEYKNHRNNSVSEKSTIKIDIDEVVKYLKSFISMVTKIPFNKIRNDSSMEKLGVESVLSMEITYALEKEFGELPKTLFFEFKTVEELAQYFIENQEEKLIQLLHLDYEEDIQNHDESPSTINIIEEVKEYEINYSEVKDNNLNIVEDSIAIIGIAGRYPQAEDLDAFWNNLASGTDCITEIPKERWDIQKMYKGMDFSKKLKCNQGGFLDEIEMFDPLFFNISPKEAELQDPQERIFLETTYKAIEDAGYTAEDLSLDGDVGVFVGVMTQEYQLFGPQQTLLGEDLVIFSTPSSIANRVSFFNDFNGPSIAIDTMCSSSITAIHLACQSLKLKECSVAIAGGVNLSLHPNKYLGLSLGNFLSKDGRCKTFSEEANGYVPSEGVGAVILKSLSEAKKDGDHIYGVIRGTSVNHGGRTNGYSVPSPKSQGNVIEKAINKAGVNPQEISYLEAHGTGTSLGDPIEIEGLNKVFRKNTDKKEFCSIGSVKSNIGHCESAAGIAALSKVLLQMKYKKLVPSIHSEVINKKIDFTNSPFKIQKELEDWNKPKINDKYINRIAGISSFGAGGSNAHIILEEFEGETFESKADIPIIIILSAKGEKQLKSRVEDLLIYLERNESITDNDLINIAYTLQVGRSSMEERVAFIANNKEDIIIKLNKILNGNEDNDIVFGKKDECGRFVELLNDDDMKNVIDEWFKKGKLYKIMELWTCGINIKWERLYKESLIKRVSLPSYRFLKKKCWAPNMDLINGTNKIIVDTNIEEKPINKNSSKEEKKETVNYVEKTATKSIDNLQKANEIKETLMGRPTFEEIEADLIKTICNILYLEEDEIDPSNNFTDIGFDSIAGVELMDELNNKYEIEIPITKTYDFSKIGDYAKFIFKLVSENTKLNYKKKDHSIEYVKEIETIKESDYIEKPEEIEDIIESDIAIIGIDGKFPKASDIEEFWDNIINYRDCIVEVPRSRWSINKFYNADEIADEKSYSKWMGLCEDSDKFDPLFFNISPAEALEMDPQQRMFLQSCYHAIEDAGINPDTLSNKKCGVFVGCSQNNYGKSENLRANRLGGATSILAGRVAYFLNLKGPTLSIDTACSSSLVSIADACNNLLLNNCELALAGGVYVIPSSELHIISSTAQMLSKDGKCHTFDTSANGFVPGEGVGVVVLKKLKDAIKDNDRIYGVIKGWNVNQDGKTNGITAPSVASQVELEKEVYDKFNINPEDVTLIECHGTGTKIGDPIEVDALVETYKNYTDKTNYCALGSVKTNIGHLINAAGIASVIKMVMALNNKTLPPTINLKEKNEYIKIDKTPFYINTEKKSWNIEEGKKRMAAISSFGFSGTNCHMVIEEYNNQNLNENNPNEELIFVLSAKDNEQLIEYVKNFQKYLINKKNINLKELTYTMQIGRAEMTERIAFTFNNYNDLLIKLSDYLEKKNNNVIHLSSSTIEKTEGLKIEELLNNYDALCRAWVKGSIIPWIKLYESYKPNKVKIPSYPFRNESYWIPEFKDSEEIVEVKDKHYLYDLQKSDAVAKKYKFSATDSDLFIKDHRVNNQNVMPGVVYLELVRAAINLDLGKYDNCIYLKDVNWLRPLIVAEEAVEISCILEANNKFRIISLLNNKKSINCVGNYEIVQNSRIENLNVEDVKKRCTKNIDSNELYKIFTSLGLDYGLSHQGIEELYIGDNMVLSKLSLPENIFNKYEEFYINPGIVDSALQSTIGLFFKDNVSNNDVLKIPFSLGEIKILKPCERQVWAHITNKGDKDDFTLIDIDIVNEQDEVIIKISNLQLRAIESKTEKLPLINDDEEGIANLLVPIWNELEEISFIENTNTGSTIVFTNDKNKVNKKGEFIKYSTITEVDNEVSINEFIKIIEETDQLENIIWISFNNEISKDYESFIKEQDTGILSLFNLVQSLISLRFNEKKINFTIITESNQAVNPYEDTNPTNSGISGFIGSVVNEITNWQLRVIDLQEDYKWPIEILNNIPYSKENNIVAYREGEWFIQELSPLEYTDTSKSSYENNGIYIVIGGAGGLGRVWSEYVIKKYNAQIIWVGRKEENIDISKEIENISFVGKRPEYMQADATKKEDLRRVRDKVIEKYGKINGIIDSAIVLKDKSIKNMDIDTFKVTYFNKVNISVRIAQVFKDDNLDFIMFFSSMMSFTKGAFQSNYSAGSVFKDTFAYWLKNQNSVNTKVINWGYFGDVGVVATNFYRENMKEFGILPIGIETAMNTLETLLIGPMIQNGLINTKEKMLSTKDNIIVDIN